MDWKATIQSLAPTVATALLGPLGGAAVSAIGGILGIDKPTQKAISDAIQGGQLTPDQIAALKTLELQYQNDEKERGFRYSELEFKDTDSARNMQIQTKSPVPAWLAFLVTGGFFSILIFMVVSPTYKPTEPLLVMLGSLGTSWTMIIGFYFGSSQSSHAKDTTIANMQAGK